MLIDDDLGDEICRRAECPAFLDKDGTVVGFPVHRWGHYAFWREYIPAESVTWSVVERGVFSVCLVMPRALWVVVDTLQEFFPDIYRPDLFVYWLWSGGFIRFSGPEWSLSTDF